MFMEGQYNEKFDEANPKNIREDYENAVAYKEGIDDLGLYEQARLNEAYMIDRHWANADIGDDLPTPMLNIIRQIMSYKIANIVSNRTDAMYSFEGIPCYQREFSAIDPESIMKTLAPEEAAPAMGAPAPAMPGLGVPENGTPEMGVPGQGMVGAGAPAPAEATEDEKLNAVAEAMSSHFSATWARTKMNSKLTRGMRKAAIGGTLVIYSPFDPNVKTGMYASNKKTPIEGDVAPELLDIQNVSFGDPNNVEVQEQPYILISQRKSLYLVKQEVRRRGGEADDITADARAGDEAGDNKASETDARTSKTTVITKFWKETDDKGTKIYMTQVCKDVVIIEKTDTGLSLYPIAIFPWHERDNCIYGYSEITGLIPNQVIVNLMLSFQVLGTMLTGMPVTIYNKEAITTEVSNSPGQIIEVQGNGDVQQAFRFVSPPTLSANWDNVLQNIIINTKIISGATDAALGDVKPDNTSAIIALRETAALPLQPMLNRYYDFIEDIARIWGEIFINKYKKRKLKLIKDGQTVYVPFDADKYKDNVLSVRIEVGSSSLWSNSTILATLNNLLMLGKISVADFLERLPDGYMDKRQELLQKLREAEKATGEMESKKTALEMQETEARINKLNAEAESKKNDAAAGDGSVDLNNVMSALTPEEQDILNAHPELLSSVMGQSTGSQITPPPQAAPV